MKNAITDLFNDIYSTGEIPEEWLTSTFIPISCYEGELIRADQLDEPRAESFS